MAPNRVVNVEKGKGVVSVNNRIRAKKPVRSKLELRKYMEFNSLEEARKFYNEYALNLGFRIRDDKVMRFQVDGSITSKRFVCSKKALKQNSKVDCQAYVEIGSLKSGRWSVGGFQKKHNHELGSNETGNDSEDDGISVEIRRNNIGSEWYGVLLKYFQQKQAEDLGFFYSIEVDNGRCMSVFWADSRSRFSCSQFGDAVVFDTTYRVLCFGSYEWYLANLHKPPRVPLVSFYGFNQHRQPVLLGCALVADECKESFVWLFETWKTMSGCQPLSIVADQEDAMREAVAQVFPGAHHRFSMWQMEAKEGENLKFLLCDGKDRNTIDKNILEYDNCVNGSRTEAEFISTWIPLLKRIKVGENIWFRRMYKLRKFWVPLYLKGLFFAGVNMTQHNKGMKSYFDSVLKARPSLTEFISEYEKSLLHNREAEDKENFMTRNSNPVLKTKEPIEEQCRNLYTRIMFKVFQDELIESYGLTVNKIDENGNTSKYALHRNENEKEKYIVTFNCSNLDVICSCQMFESEGMLCRHTLAVFLLQNVQQIPSKYILRRWTRDAENGFVCDIKSGDKSSKDLMASMVWSLREEARKYIESGAWPEKYNAAFKVLQENRRKLESSQSDGILSSTVQDCKRYKTSDVKEETSDDLHLPVPPRSEGQVAES